MLEIVISAEKLINVKVKTGLCFGRAISREKLLSCLSIRQEHGRREETELASWLLRMDDMKFLQMPSLAKSQEDSIKHKISSRNIHLSFLF